jgi:hypothetical protein
MSLREVGRRDLSLVDLLDRILDKGVVINGDITVTIGRVELLSLKINLVIASLETAKRYGIRLPWEPAPRPRRPLRGRSRALPAPMRWPRLEAYASRQLPQKLQRLDLSGDSAKLQNGLARLVLAIAELLKEVLERQALRRVESGTLTKEEVERLGLAFIEIDRKLLEMSREFGMKPGELKAELAELIRGAGVGASSTDIVKVIDRFLDKGVAVAGQVRIAVADIDLIGLDLLAVLYPVYKKGEW